MDFQLSEEQRLLKQTARRIAEEELADRAFTFDGAYPMENAPILAEAGLLGISIPEPYGGGGMTPIEVLMVQEEIGRICPDTAHLISHTSMGAPRAIAHLGTDYLKEKYLPGICAGEYVMAIAISEAEAGSAAGEMQTTAEDDGDGVVLNGSKLWISHPLAAEAFLVYAKFEEGIGGVIVDKDADGIEIAETYTNMYGGHHAELVFDDCRVDNEQVLIRGEDAFKTLLQTFNVERCHNAMMSVSMARNAFEKSLEYAQDREQFGQPIGEFQAVSHKLADMAINLEAARLLVFQAANATMTEDDDGLPTRLLTSVAKVFANEMAEEIASDAVQIHGANGYMQGHPVEYLYRKVRGREIAGGTVEIHRNGIVDALYKHGYDPY
ncbi:MAG: acyl-CoA dehydrogenase family protein [Halobacteriales archaeon]